MNSLIPKPQNSGNSALTITEEASMLTSAQYRQLSEVPPAIEWSANIDNPQTRRAYENDLRDLMQFVKGVKRPVVESQQEKNPALGDAQVRALLSTPDANTLKGKRDRAILSALLYHVLRREELIKLKLRDYCQQRRGVAHLQVQGWVAPIKPDRMRLVIGCGCR